LPPAAQTTLEAAKEFPVRAVVQRVTRARVLVDQEEVGRVGKGLLVLVGVAEGDGPADLGWLKRKLLTLRVFPDDAGKMNLSVTDVQGELLLVSQFTLCANMSKGSRPSFDVAMAPDRAEALFDLLVAELRAELPVATGRFGAHMDVELLNHGPVTLWLESPRGTR
jgi:D-aminoacyl-tRNA deacylase